MYKVNITEEIYFYLPFYDGWSLRNFVGSTSSQACTIDNPHTWLIKKIFYTEPNRSMTSFPNLFLSLNKLVCFITRSNLFIVALASSHSWTLIRCKHVLWLHIIYNMTLHERKRLDWIMVYSTDNPLWRSYT